MDRRRRRPATATVPAAAAAPPLNVASLARPRDARRRDDLAGAGDVPARGGFRGRGGLLPTPDHCLVGVTGLECGQM